jgi:hypothetical protein
MDAYIIIEEVPYGLNVVSGNIALLPIAVELCRHLRLVNYYLASGCEYTRNASFQMPLLFRAHSDRHYYSIYQTKLGDATDPASVPAPIQERCFLFYTKRHFFAIDGLAPSTSRLQFRTLLLELYCILKIKCQKSISDFVLLGFA